MPNQTTHKPVLLEEALYYLRPQEGESFLDVTAGLGGHAKGVLALTKNFKEVVLIDRDATAVTELKHLFVKKGIQIIHQDFLRASEALAGEGRRFDMILADLGVSSPHLNQPERGFSIKRPGPLDMRMDSSQLLTAAQIVNQASEAELSSIFNVYGEEPKARQIARRIIQERPLKTTDQLAAIAASVWPGRSRKHPATRIFQALRIAVNDELSQLQNSLPIWLGLLTPGGRLAVISYHSLEDRIVKHFFAENSAERLDGELEILTKKPVAASYEEIVSNPRARSAKLRAAAKIKTKRKDIRKTRNAYKGTESFPGLQNPGQSHKRL